MFDEADTDFSGRNAVVHQSMFLINTNGTNPVLNDGSHKHILLGAMTTYASLNDQR